MQDASSRQNCLISQAAGALTIFLGGLLLFIATLLLTPAAYAQYRASIQGVVTDPQGEVVPGATVTLTNTETNRSVTRTTGGNGVYTFSGLPPSRYSMIVEAEGFKKKVLNNVGVVPEQANAVNVRLELGEATQTVTVSGSGEPLLNRETASIGGTVTGNEIQHLPSFGRDVFQLAQLAPGVFGDGSQASGGGTNSLPASNSGGSSADAGIFQTENAPQIIGNGGQNQTNGITIDGISTVSAVWGGASVITPSEESVKDVQVVANSYDAENGRFSSAHIQVTTKNGTNQLQGSLFFRADRPGLNAYQRWNGSSSEVPGTPLQRGLNRNDSRFNQFGGSLGGPIWKNKIFAFFSYETLREGSLTSGTGWYETPQFLKMARPGSIAAAILGFPGEGASFSSILSQTCANIGLVEGTQCRTIPGQGLNLGSPLTSPLGTHDPTWGGGSGTPGIGNGLTNIPTIAFVSTLNPTTTTEAQYSGRLDANITAKDLVTFTIYWVPVSNTNYNGSNRPANLWHHQAINDAFTGLWEHNFSPNLLNEARADAAGWRWNEIDTNPQEPFGLPLDSIDSLGTAGVGSFGAPGPSVFNQWTYNYADAVTKVQGSHQLKFGGQFTRLYYLNEATYSATPSYNFRNMWDLLNDAPYQESANFNPKTGAVTANRQDERSNLFSFFVQDDYKVKPNLTLNLGLRWEYFGPLYSKDKNLSVLQLGSGANALTGMSFKIGGNLYKAQKGNFGPQFGFAWSPGAIESKMVVRGGFGVNYDQQEIAIAANGNANPPSVVGVTLCCSAYGQPLNSIVYAVSSDVHSLYGYPANPHVVSPYGANNLPLTGAPISAVGYPSTLPTTYSYHYSLDTQDDLGRMWVATLGYQGSMSRHLIREYNANIVAAAQGIPMNPMVNSLGWFANDANANYNAMLAGLKHQFGRSFMADVEYAWSKSMDEGSQPYYGDPYPYVPHEAWGRSEYNVTNAFKVYGMWQPVLFRGSRAWLEKVAGGWSISGILNIHSGFPWTPVYSNTGCNIIYQGSGFCQLRPAKYLGGAGNDTSNAAFKSGPAPANESAFNRNFSRGALSYFNVPNFTSGPAFPATGPLPENSSVARNTLNGPGYRDVDMTLMKTFGFPNMPVLGRDASLSVRADAYNLLNTLNLDGSTIDNVISTDGVTSNQSFGQAGNALGSRTIEIQARFQF